MSPNNLKVFGYYIVVLLALSCSCQPGRSRFGVLEPLSGFYVECLDNNCFPLEACSIDREGDTVVVRYNFRSEDCLCSSGAKLLTDCSEGWKVSMNGMPMYGLSAISGVVQEGENTVELRGSGEAPSVSLVGAFDVLSSEEGLYLRSAKSPGFGSFSSQGLLLYDGQVSYRRQYEVAGKVGKRILRVGKWSGSRCEVYVNYDKVADVTSQHCKLDIGPYLTPGPNDVEVRISGPDPGLLKAFTLK